MSQSLLLRLRSENARHGLIALLDQGIVSGINFLTLLILARYMLPTIYGQYVLIMAVLLLINAMQTSLITSPLMVLAPHYSGRRSTQYLTSLWLIQCVGSLIAGVAALIAISLAIVWQTGLAEVLHAPALVLLIVAYLSQEFIRRVLFSQQDSLGGLFVDVLSYGLQCLVMLSMIVQGQLTLPRVFWAMGITSLLSCCFGFARWHPTLSMVSRASLHSTWRQHWLHGRWLLSSSLTQWGSSQFYYFVVAAVLSPAATGLFAASRNLLGVTHIFLLSLENFVPPMATRQWLSGGMDALVRWTNQFRLFSAVLMGAYCLLVALFADPLMSMLFGPNYADSREIVILTAVGYFIYIFHRPPIIALRVVGELQWIFYATLASLIVTLIIALPLVKLGGLHGAALGMIMTQVIALWTINFGYQRVITSVSGSKRSQLREDGLSSELSSS